MNRSGHAVATAVGYYKLTPSDVLVVTDDMALAVGRLRLRVKGSAGGHNGLKDIIARLRSDAFPRLRMGIGASGPVDAADYVLSRFAPDERQMVQTAVQSAADAVECWLREGVDAAMTRYNAKPNAGSGDTSESEKETR
jgi:PTH1 family peptidyl-tRNA hydrolase